MPAQNGGPPSDRDPSQAAVLAAALLLMHAIEQEERGGLSRRVALLAAVAEMDLDPALILRRAKGAMA